MSIAIQNVCKRFGSFLALDDVSLVIEPGELVALLGPSGSGKTTLLRIIAGLDFADRGHVMVDDENAATRDMRERSIGFVFQHYALFRHMTVFENVAFGLRVKSRRERPSRKAIEKKVQELLALIQLEQFAKRYPHQLSGGQRQRVALARALAIEPRVLLLDEPFGALDAKVRKDLRRWLRNLHDEIHLTSVFVTHDQEEALEVADRVVVFNQGKIQQVGTPKDVYDRPATPFVYGFLGHANRFDSEISDGYANIGTTRLALAKADGRPQANGVAYVRPHDIEVSMGAKPNATKATVEHVATLGAVVRIELISEPRGSPLDVHLTREEFEHLRIEKGSVVWLTPKRARIFAGSDKHLTALYDVERANSRSGSEAEAAFDGMSDHG